MGMYDVCAFGSSATSDIRQRPLDSDRNRPGLRFRPNATTQRQYSIGSAVYRSDACHPAHCSLVFCGFVAIRFGCSDCDGLKESIAAGALVALCIDLLCWISLAAKCELGEITSHSSHAARR